MSWGFSHRLSTFIAAYRKYLDLFPSSPRLISSSNKIISILHMYEFIANGTAKYIFYDDSMLLIQWINILLYFVSIIKCHHACNHAFIMQPISNFRWQIKINNYDYTINLDIFTQTLLGQRKKKVMIKYLRWLQIVCPTNCMGKLHCSIITPWFLPFTLLTFSNRKQKNNPNIEFHFTYNDSSIMW